MSSLKAPPRCARIANAAPPRQRHSSATSLGSSGAWTATASSASASCSSAATRRASGVGAVGFGDDHERGAVGDAEGIRVARVLERDGVEVLDRGGHDARREHALDRADACLGVAVEADHGQLELGRGDELQPRRGDQPERPFGTDEQVLHVVARNVLAQRAADVDDLAGRDHDLDPRHPVAGDAVLERVRAAGVAGDVAADLRDLGRARVGREAEAALAREPLHVAGRDARLDVHPPEQRIELAHLVQPLEADHDAALDRDRTAGEAGAAAARGQRHVVLVAPAHHRRDLVDGRRHDHRVGRPLHAAAHQIREIAALRFDERFRGNDFREIHGRERTLSEAGIRTIRGVPGQ